METLIIHIENPSHTQKVKDFLKQLNVNVEVYPQHNVVQEQLPEYVVNLMEKSLVEADEKLFTSHQDFFSSVKKKYTK